MRIVYSIEHNASASPGRLKVPGGQKARQSQADGHVPAGVQPHEPGGRRSVRRRSAGHCRGCGSGGGGGGGGVGVHAPADVAIVLLSCHVLAKRESSQSVTGQIAYDNLHLLAKRRATRKLAQRPRPDLAALCELRGDVADRSIPAVYDLGLDGQKKFFRMHFLITCFAQTCLSPGQRH